MFGAREFLTHPVGVLFLTCSSFTVSPMAGQLTFGTRTQSQCDGNKIKMPDCCFLEAGIVALTLRADFNRTGSAACASCQQLETVDLSQQTCLRFVPLYRRFPPALLCMARCAFLQVARNFEQYASKEKRKTWRGTCARPYVK